MQISEAKQENEKDRAPVWYIVRSATRQEARAVEGLGEAGFVAYCPRLIRWGYRGRGGRVRVEQPLFPGYLFVELPAPARFDLVRGADGVHAFLNRDGRPASIPAKAVRSLQQREADAEFDKTVRKAPVGPFKPGDSVAIVAGKFTDWPAQVVEMDSAERVRVLLRAFGRDHEKTFPLGDVRAA